MADLLARLSATLGDRYRMDRELGGGGMGIVLLAHDRKHDRSVALKVLRPELAQGVNAERFLREIRITAGLQHPNILPLLDSGETDGLMYYVMPYVTGESLGNRLDRQKQLPIEDALQIAREVADALAYAHSRGFVHRDIKPENILLSAGHALVADFGIAHSLLGAGEKLTQTGMAIGTPAYMSPEQATGDVDHRTDIYALGCVLYEMLAGTTPFTGTYQVVMARKMAEPVPGLRVVRDTVPEHVERIVMKALARVPADRFRTATELVAALAGDARALNSGTVQSRAAGRKRWMLAGAAGAVLLVMGAYAAMAGRPFAPAGRLMERATYAQLTSDPGIEWFPSLSADARWIVYAGQQSGNRDIYLQSVSGQTPINLTKDSPADDDQPAFSPDGERIAFRSARDGGGIFVMGRTGEAARRLTTHGFRPTWSSDGKQIAFVSENVDINPGNSEGISQLFVVAAQGGEPRRLSAGDAILPSWSPNGHRIAFGHRLGTPAQGDIWTIAPTGGAPVPLTSDAARDWSPSWSPDGRFVYFSSDRGGSMNLWRIAVDEASGKPTGVPEALTTPATSLGHPTLAGDGSRIAYTSTQVLINIQRIAFDPVAGTVVGDAIPVTTGSRQYSSPDPSPDGEWVAYYTLTQPEGDIYVSRPDGTQRRQLTADTAIDRLPRWSPDGQVIMHFSTRGGMLQLWTVGADGSGLRRISSRSSTYIAWSPDGRRVAAITGPLALADTVAIFDATAPDDQEPQLLPRSPIGPFLVNSWSPDGERLAGQVGAMGGMGRGIAVYSFAAKTYTKLTDFGEWPVWLPDSRRILFVANRQEFWMIDLRGGDARKVWSVERDVIGPPRLTRDGRWAYFSRRATEGDIWMLTLPSPSPPK